MTTTALKKIYLFIFSIMLLFLIQETYSIQCDTCPLCDQYADTYDLIELNKSISNATGTCINIEKSNVIINCNGFNITGGGSSEGIRVGSRTNITIKNCTIKNFNYGIYEYIGVTNSTLANNTLTSNNYGLHLYSNTDYNNITKNTFISNNIYGIYIYNSNLNRLEFNEIINNNGGIRIKSSDNNTLYNNKIKNNTNYEINVTGDYNNISRNYFKNDVVPATNYPPSTIFENNIFADWTAGPPGKFLADFETITEALTSASAGNIIYAFKKTYSECLNITKTLTIKGEEKHTTKINCTGSIPLNVSTDNFRLSNFTLISNTLYYPALYLGGNYAHISDIIVEYQQKGIHIPGTNHHLLKYINMTYTPSGLNITSSGNTTLTLSKFTNSNIHTLSSTNIQITNSTFENIENSTILENTNDSLIANNTYENITHPIQIISSTNTNTTKNRFLIDVDIPLILSQTKNSKISENFMIYPDYAIIAHDSDAITIENNKINITVNTSITLTNTNNTHITNNTITTAQKAITIESGNANTIYNNTITGTINTSISFIPQSGTKTEYHDNTIEKNTIEDSHKAISMQNTYNTKISQNKITDTGESPTIYLKNATQDNITGNTFIGGTAAIRLKNANQTLTQANNISGYDGICIAFDTSSSSHNIENTIRDNTITSRLIALSISHNTNSRIINNTITGTGSMNYGIYIYNTNSTNITNNTIEHSQNHGIKLDKCENNIIGNNTIIALSGGGIYSSGSVQYPNPNNTISNNHIQSKSYSIQLLNILRPAIIGNTITSTENDAIYIDYVNYATVENNTISNSNIGLSIANSEYNNIKNNTIKNNNEKGIDIGYGSCKYNNITENSFQNNAKGIYIKQLAGITNNNLWLNNFSDSDNNFNVNNNYYCIMGLDNHYHTNNPPYNNPPLSCSRALTTTHNDTAIYINDTIKFTTDTFGGESSYASLNITINNTNHTMALAQGNSITGNWTYTFKDTLLPGTYNAAYIYYHETDNDEGTRPITGLSFEVMELSMHVNISPQTANINDTINIRVTVWDNASAIENVTSKIYWNNTLKDTQNQTTFTKINDSARIFDLSTSKTHRSGTYTVNTTIYAGSQNTHTDTFSINYGHAGITINELPYSIPYNMTTPQNYTITATGGDLNHTTLTFTPGNASIINITTPTQIIPYINASETLHLSISMSAISTGTANITITAEPQNGTGDTEAKNITVKKINMTAEIYPKTANRTENITITASVENNATEITSVTAEIYWNGTHKGTVPLSHISTESHTEEPRYKYETTTSLTGRSGNYTVNITAAASNNATAAGYYYINYGHADITTYTSPSAMNTDTKAPQYVNITATGGDLKDIEACLTIDDTSKLNLTLNENDTKNHEYLNAGNILTVSWQIEAKNTPNATINITVNAYNTTQTSETKTIDIKELKLDTALNATTVNITNAVRIYANISGNITDIEYVTANITWNSTSKQNITLDYHSYHAEEEKHTYTGAITSTDRSGNYSAFTEAKANITINTTEPFFVNYGTPEVSFTTYPKRINLSQKTEQKIIIEAVNGDLANITINLASDNETILNLSDSQNPVQTIKFIGNGIADDDIYYNLTGKTLGTTNITANVTSESSSPVIEKKKITVGEAESNRPDVTAIWTNSSINTYNLLNSIAIYANIEEDSGFNDDGVVAEITKPDGYKENQTMEESSGGTFITKSPFTNTTETDNYTIKIYATDYYDNTNDTETRNFTVNNTYPATTIETESQYNRGENATITICVYDVNNNQVTGFNTTLNITYESNTTTLLENNRTDTCKYYINTSVLGIHSLSASITKNGNTGSDTSTFNATNILDMSFYTSLAIYPPTSWIREFTLYTNYKRGDPYTDNLNANLYCYNDSSNHWGIVALAKSSSNRYTYTTTGDPQCYAPSPSCHEFKITANITDAYNNTGTKILTLSTSGCTTQDPGGPGGGTSSGGGIAGFVQNISERVKEVFIGDRTNTTAIISDFKFTLSKKEIRIKQGEDTTIIATLDNIGDVEQKITAAITKQCCNITIKDTTYTIPKKNKKDIPIHIHNSLTTHPGEYLIIITMASENITKTETVTIVIEENPLVADLRNLENKIKEHEKEIESYTITGIDTSYMEKTLKELKTQVANAKQYIEKDDLKNLKTSISEAKKKSDRITLELLRLKTQKWLYENKEMIAVTIIAIIILTYLSIYFIIPYYYLKKELTSLKTKELELKDAEKSVQKQYFMRQLDEATFNKLISEKHSLLLDTRSQIKQIQEKITLLTRGKLNLKEEQHSKYFILNKIAPKKQAPIEKKFQIKEKIKSLKEQEYNITQSIKEAEKNYYSRIITQDELEQITNINRAKLESIKKQRSTLEQLQTAAPTKESEHKQGILSKIMQKYTQYKHQRQKARAENKMGELKKHEDALEKRDMEIKAKEERIKKEMETLKKETQPTGSE